MNGLNRDVDGRLLASTRRQEAKWKGPGRAKGLSFSI